MQVGRTAAVAGASGYAGGELLRLLLGHPELSARPGRGGHARPGSRSPRCTRSCRSSPAPPSPPTEPAVLADADLVFLALPHGAVRGAGRRSCPPTCRSSTSAPTSGSTDAAAWAGLLRRPARRQLALRPARAARRPRPRSPARSRVANPGCYADGGRARPRAAARRRPGRAGRRRGRRRLRHVRRRAAPPKPHLLASEVMGALSPYKAGGAHQHTPEMEQSLTAAAGAP